MAGCFSANYNTTKYFYFGVFAITAVLTWILRDYAAKPLSNIGPMRSCLANIDAGQRADCAGKQVVLRMSFGSFIFFAAHFLCLLGVSKKEDPRRHLHTGLLPLQLAVWIGTLVAMFAIPSYVFDTYGQIARVLAGIFLIIQIILLLGFIYIINDFLISKDELSHRIALVGASTCMLAGGLVILGFMYHYYAPYASCGLNIFFITWTLIMALFYTALSVSPWRAKGAGLLTAAIVSIYTAVVLFNALSSEPEDDRCIRLTGVAGGLQIFFFFFGLVIIGIGVMTSSLEGSSFQIGNDSSGDEGLPYRPDFYHLIFMLASAYIAMIFTSWSLAGASRRLTNSRDWPSVWVKIASQWLCVLLYTWSLLAPTILKDREF